MDTCCCCLVTKSCLTHCEPVDYSSSRSSVHGILQARVLACLAIPFFRGSSRDWTWLSCIAGRFYCWATRGYLDHWNFSLSFLLRAFKSRNVSLAMASAACSKLQVLICNILILIQFQIFTKFHLLVPFISFAFFYIFLCIMLVKDLSKNMKSLNDFNHSKFFKSFMA